MSQCTVVPVALSTGGRTGRSPGRPSPSPAFLASGSILIPVGMPRYFADSTPVRLANVIPTRWSIYPAAVAHGPRYVHCANFLDHIGAIR